MWRSSRTLVFLFVGITTVTAFPGNLDELLREKRVAIFPVCDGSGDCAVNITTSLTVAEDNVTSLEEDQRTHEKSTVSDTSVSKDSGESKSGKCGKQVVDTTGEREVTNAPLTTLVQTNTTARSGPGGSDPATSTRGVVPTR